MVFICNSRKRYLFYVLTSIAGLFLIGNAGAFTVDKDIRSYRYFEKVSTVMEVHADRSAIVISERAYYLADYTIDGETKTTELMDADGNMINLTAFAPGEPVIVWAVELDDGRYIALRIQKGQSDGSSSDGTNRPGRTKKSNGVRKSTTGVRKSGTGQ